MLYHPLLMHELARLRQEELVAAAVRRRAAVSNRPRRPRGRVQTAAGWALVDVGLRLVTAGAAVGKDG
jgi:hypothetical protein